MKKLGLSAKVILTLVLVLALVMVAGSLLLIQNQKNLLKQKMEKEAAILSNSVGLTINNLITGGVRNRDYLQKMTEELGSLPGIHEIVVYDREGVVLADSDKKWIGQSKAKEFEDVKNVLETGKGFRGTEMVEGKKLYSNAFPIYLEAGGKRDIAAVGEVNVDFEKVTQALTLQEQADLLAKVVGFSLEKIMHDDAEDQSYLQSLTEELGKTEGVQELVIYNPEGVVIGDTDRKWLGENKAGEFEDLKEVLKTQRPYQNYEIYEEGEVFSSLVPVFSKDKKFIAVVEAAMSISFVQAQVALARNRILLLTLVSILVVSLLIFLLLRKNVLSPIQKLANTMKQIAIGDLSKRADITSGDEIGEMAETFNNMATSIQDKNEEIQTFNEELQTSNEELKTANEELRETQEKLVQKEKLAAVGQLASGVGHELRNPLGVMKNAVYYIKTKVGGGAEKVAKHLRILEKEIDGSTKIISDLLGFSRTRKPAIAPTDVNHIIENIIPTLEVPSNVRIAKELRNISPAMVDSDQVRQVFLNLFLNGIQAMNEGGLLTVETGKKDNFIEVLVKDTGCGIPKENLSKLFDPFFTTKSRGIGLGLAVSHGIVERNGGSIEVQSVIGKGTTFTVLLPQSVG